VVMCLPIVPPNRAAPFDRLANAVFTGLPPAKNRQKIGAAPVER
jgi:hypothetical protein